MAPVRLEVPDTTDVPHAAHDIESAFFEIDYPRNKFSVVAVVHQAAAGSRFLHGRKRHEPDSPLTAEIYHIVHVVDVLRAYADVEIQLESQFGRKIVGHEDIVEDLPGGALCSSHQVIGLGKIHGVQADHQDIDVLQRFAVALQGKSVGEQDHLAVTQFLRTGKDILQVVPDQGFSPGENDPVGLAAQDLEHPQPVIGAKLEINSLVGIAGALAVIAVDAMQVAPVSQVHIRQQGTVTGTDVQQSQQRVLHKISFQLKHVLPKHYTLRPRPTRRSAYFSSTMVLR